MKIEEPAEEPGFSEEEYRLQAMRAAGLRIWDWNLESGEIYLDTNRFHQSDDHPESNTLSFDDWLALIHPDDNERTRKQLTNILENASDRCSCEFRIRRDDESWRWVHLCGRIVKRDIRNLPLRFLGVMVSTEDCINGDAALRQSEERYRLLVEASQVAMYILVDGRYEVVNPRFTELLGYSAEEITSPQFSFMDYMAPCSRPMMEERLRMLENGEEPPSRYEFTAITKGGQQIELEAAVSRFYRNGQRITHGILHDISQRKRDEKTRNVLLKIWESANHADTLDMLLDSVREELHTLLDIHGFAVTLYQGDRESYTFPETDAKDHISNRPSTLVPDRALVDYVRRTGNPLMADKEKRESLVEQGEAIQVVTGAEWWLGVPIKTGNQVFGVISAHDHHPRQVIARQNLDILSFISGHLSLAIQRRLAEDANRESERRLHMIIQNMPVMMNALDEDGNIIAWNRECERVTGYNADEIIGNPDAFKSLYPDYEYREKMLRMWRERIHNYRHWEWNLTCKDGTQRIISWSSVAQDYPMPGWATWDLGIDVTDRNRAEASLRESEEKYRLLIENQSDLVVKTDAQGRFLFVSPSYCELFGKTEAELLGKHYIPLVHEDDREATLQAVEALGNPPHSCYVEQRALTKDGWRWLAWADKAVLDENNNLVEIVGVGRDITEKKKADLALRESEERFRIAFTTSPDAICISRTEDGLIVDVNDGMLVLSGYSRNEMVGHTSSELQLWDLQENRSCMINDLKNHGFVANLENKFRLKGGRLITGLMSARIIHLGGEPYILSITRDIDDLKKAENAVRESEERLRAIFESARDSIFIKDLEGRYVALNPGMERLFGMTADHIIGRTDSELFGEEIGRHIAATDLKVITGEEIEERNTRAVRGDNRTFHVVKVPMRNAEGDIIGICGIARDITETRRLQEFAERAQRLEAAGRIAGQVAHDFNNLLGPLLAYPGFVRDELPDAHPAVGFLNDMETAAEKMAEINQQLLTLSRRGHYSLEPLCLNEIVGQVLDQFPSMPRDVVVTTELDQNLMNINGGASQLYRVVANLIANAVDAMHGEGELLVRTENYDIRSFTEKYKHAPKGAYVKLTVTDTGCGISYTDRARIFDPFFTTKTADRRRGSGLGLSVVHAVIDDHDGFIDLNSAVGMGTSFYIYFPVTDKPLNKYRNEAIVGGCECVLLVDDDRMQRDVTRRLLEKLGYSTDASPSGEKALEFLENNPRDLIILDMDMAAGIDGAETFRRALEINPHQKAIIVSGYSESERVEAALKLGAGAFVKKPLTLKTLAAAVRKELDRKTDGKKSG